MSDVTLLLRVFIAWVNLDLGISTCFYNGMDTYAKTWLQFVFPLYILVLVSAIIFATRYSTWAVKLFGSNAVPVLATLFLLSYAKMLHILIAAFSFAELHDENNNTRVVWLLDGNVNYFEAKHVVFMVIALLVLIVAIPYTSVLILAPWIQKSRFAWMSRVYNKCKPLFDAYMGPYKDKYRYWTGLLLLVRVVLFILFSAIGDTINTLGSTSINLMIVNLASSFLAILTAFFKPYKRRENNVLELFYLLNLVCLSSSSLYIIGHEQLQEKNQVYAFSVLVGMAFLVFILVIGYHTYQKMPTKQCHRTVPPPSPNADRNVEDVVIERSFRTNSTIFSVYRESVLELN